VNSGEVSVFNRTKRTVLAQRARVASSVLSRLLGLLGRSSLDAGCGLWLVPANSIHTVGMLFRIDVVLIDRGRKVVAVRNGMRPFSILLPNFRARSVLELPAHTIQKTATEIGDELQIESYEAG
jgi:uncharacterized membrane protein (UPF0127 family)